MYAINPQFRHIKSFAEAHARLLKDNGFTQAHAKDLKAARAAGWDDNAERALDGRKKHMTLRLLNKQDTIDMYKDIFGNVLDQEVRDMVSQKHIAFKLHTTDVVVYREDDAIILRRYGSASTNIFADRLLPSTVQAQFSTTHDSDKFSGLDYITCIDRDPKDIDKDRAHKRRIYDMSQHMMLLLCTDKKLGRYEPHDMSITQWNIPTIDLTKARRVSRDTGLTTFRKAIHVYAHMMWGDHFYQDATRLLVPDVDMLLALLKDRGQGWKTLMSIATWWPAKLQYGDAVNRCGWARQAALATLEKLQADPSHYATMHADAMCAALKVHLYKLCDVYKLQEAPYVTSVAALERAFRTTQEFGDHV